MRPSLSDEYFSVFNQNFGRFLTSHTNQPHMDAWKTLSSTYDIIKKDGKPSKSRLAWGWAIVRPTVSVAQLNLCVEGIGQDPRTRFEAFTDELSKWDETPRMFLVFAKAPIPIVNLFITVDLRAVRICSPGGVETFDYTKPAHPKAGKMQRILEKQRTKNAA